jgi:hypothetical protein
MRTNEATLMAEREAARADVERERIAAKLTNCAPN